MTYLHLDVKNFINISFVLLTYSLSNSIKYFPSTSFTCNMIFITSSNSNGKLFPSLSLFTIQQGPASGEQIFKFTLSTTIKVIGSFLHIPSSSTIISYLVFPKSI